MGSFAFNGDEGITINGLRLAIATSQEDGKTRWSEITLYKTQTGYVAAGVGCSDRPGETDRHWISWAAGPEDFVKALRRPDGKGNKFLPSYARQALDDAARADSSLLLALVSYDAWER